MSLRQAQLPTASAVVANQDALFHIPAGRKVHTVWLDISESTNAVTLASGNLIGDIQVIIGQKTQRQVTGVQLNHINSCNDKDTAAKIVGQAGVAGYRTLLPIQFAEPSRKDPAQIRASAVPLNGPGIDGMDIKVRIGNLTTPVLSGWYEYEPSAEVLTVLAKYLRKTYNATGTTVEDPQLERRDILQAIHFFNTSDGKYVKQLDMKADGEYYREQITYSQNQASLLNRSLNPDVNATPIYDLIFDYDDPVDQWLVAAGRRDLSFKATLDGASTGTLDVVRVQVGPLE